jgi:osmotically-inducible protein OsmY
MVKSDSLIKQQVAAELAWDSELDPGKVGIAVRDGIVTLSGTMDTFMEKHAVERAVRRVSGLRGIALDLDVKLAPGHKRADAEIAQASVNALRWHSLVPADSVRAEVEDGWVTLTGEVDWPYQRRIAGQCVAPLRGVSGVNNQITLRHRAAPEEMREQIVAALERHALQEAQQISIEVEGSTVTLSGQVDSLAEHDTAIRTASATRGVTQVVDRLKVA